MTERHADLHLTELVTSFFTHAREEEPNVTAYLEALDPDGHHELAGILGRFDPKRRGHLDPTQRLFAYRILGRLHRPTTHSLVQVNKILDYMDLNANSLIEENELELVTQVFELFAHAESDNDTLSERELDMLYAVLRHIDDNDSRFLEPHERLTLRQALEDPKGFMDHQRAHNPLLKAILADQHR